jgi:hypothetical protein
MKLIHIAAEQVQLNLPDVAALAGTAGVLTAWLAPIDLVLKIVVSLLSLVALTLTVRAHWNKRKEKPNG